MKGNCWKIFLIKKKIKININIETVCSVSVSCSKDNSHFIDNVIYFNVLNDNYPLSGKKCFFLSNVKILVQFVTLSLCNDASCCVNAGAKMTFGSGTRLTVEASEYRYTS